MQTITESTSTITISPDKKLSRKVPIFYNPVMKTNRDLSIAVLNAFDKNQLQICDLFAASGIRSIRFLKELKPNKIKNITINDYSNEAVKIIKQNLKDNNLENDKRVIITEKEADQLLHESNGFDYIDIDPFGTPVPFLDMACKRLARDSILAVTATDTSALAGSSPNACIRKYDAVPLRCPIMHEIGLRILIRKCQVIAAQYDKALTPIFSYFKDHYMRIFFHCEKGRTRVDKILKQHGTMQYKGKIAGSLWKGKLWDISFVKKMKSEPFLDIIKNEMTIDQLGFYDIHAICRELKIQVPQYEKLFNAIKNSGYKVARTHFSLEGIRSTINEEELKKIIKDLV